MGKFVWCEDTGAGLIFWRNIFEVLDKEITVQSKGNNSNLRKAVEQVAEDDNTYYIFMDMAIDNPDVLRETQRVYKIAAGKKNVITVKIHSFEYALLSFEMLENWVFAKDDELKNKRTKYLTARDIFIKMITEEIDVTERKRLFDLTKYDEKKNSEQIAASLLRDITKNTGFATTKNKLGECFINDCCTWANRQSDDICGLDDERLDADTKRKMLVEYSALQTPFSEVGLL